ncbi:MAG: hypothetical protein KUG78_00825 [Kangiellaceae bacterium]|nr:hypothetical protein [Kangiellaceae bacterium]
MNKHKKLAIFIAPFLMVVGYIASDYYLEYQAQEDQLFQLNVEGDCDVLINQCVLSAGEFKLNVFDVEGATTVNSTFPLDKLTLFIVDENNHSSPYILTKQQTAYYWHVETPLRKMLSSSALPQKIRIIAKVKGGQYISEFSTKEGY